ncbi:hypothetical protein ES703_115900 [subsurface metagenome]
MGIGVGVGVGAGAGDGVGAGAGDGVGVGAGVGAGACPAQAVVTRASKAKKVITAYIFDLSILVLLKKLFLLLYNELDC